MSAFHQRPSVKHTLYPLNLGTPLTIE